MGSDARFGLDDASAFAEVSGEASAPAAGPQAAWYFAGECVAVPRGGGASFSTDRRPMHDLRLWSDAHPFAPRALPPLVWLGATGVVRNALLAPDARSYGADGVTAPLRFVARLPSNRSWFDATSAAFFAAGPVQLRGTREDDALLVRALWPQSWRLGPRAAAPAPLPDAVRPGLALRARIQATPAAALAFEATSLWQRRPGSGWAGKAVLAFIVNGAQGDDDEAHGGHFSIATGRIADDGDIGSWLVNSFYSLDVVSEKGILAAPVPLDRYQGDLNSGQSWYRPSWALVAVLDDERAAVRVQAALGRLYRHFWRGQQPYYHPTDNCTSLAVDTLRALGLDVPRYGASGRFKAWAALPTVALQERRWQAGKLAFDYLVTERTRLLPALALEAVFEALLGLAQRKTAPEGVLGRELAEDLDALAWLALPQFPSSRAWGGPPVASLAEYHASMPADPAQRQIIPLPPRHLPDALRDDDLLPALPHPSDNAVRWLAVAPLAVVAAMLALRGR